MAPHRTRVFGALAVLVAAVPGLAQGGNILDRHWADGIERVYRRALGGAERRAGAIAGPLARAEDPRNEADAFLAFMTDTFGVTFERALAGVDRSPFRDEDQRRDSLVRLMAVAGNLSTWHRGSEGRLVELSRGLEAVDRHYGTCLADLKAACKDVLDETERPRFAARFDDLAKQAQGCFETYDRAAKTDAHWQSALRECGDVGEDLAEALEDGCRVFAATRGDFEHGFSHLTDWRGARSRSGILFAKATLAADKQAEYARRQLEKSVGYFRSRLSPELLDKPVEELIRRAQREDAREHHYARWSQFQKAQRELSKFLANLRRDRAAFRQRLAKDEHALKTGFEQDLRRLEPLLAKTQEQVALAKRIVEIERELHTSADHARELMDRSEKRVDLLERRAIGFGEMVVLIQQCEGFDRSVDETVRELRKVRNASVETAIDLLDLPLGKIRKLENAASTVQALKQLNRIEAQEHGNVRWTKAGRLATVVGTTKDLASIIVPFVNTVDTLFTYTKTAGGGLLFFKRTLGGDPSLLNEAVDDPDGFAARHLTNGVYDHLDSVTFRNLADLKNRLSAADFDPLNTDEGRRLTQLESSVNDAAQSLAGTRDDRARELAAELRRLLALIRKAAQKSGAEVNAAFDDVVDVALGYAQERQAERESYHDARRAALEDLGARIVRLGYDVEPRTRERLLGLDAQAQTSLERDLDDEAAKAPYDKALAAVDRAIATLSREVERAEREVRR